MVHFTNTTDRFHENYSNIFLLQQKVVFASGEYTADRGGGATGPAMAEAYPQIQTIHQNGTIG